MIEHARIALWRGIEGTAVLFAKVFGTARMARESAALAERYGGRDDWQMAAFFGRVAIAADPSLAQGYAALGRAYYRSRNAKKAEDAFRGLLELDRDNRTALLHLAMILKEEGRYGEAEELLDRLVDLNASIAALALLGEIKFHTGDMQSARKYLELSINSGDKRAKTYYSISLAYAAMNQTNEAIAAARRASILDPQDEEYRTLVEKLTSVVETNARVSMVESIHSKEMG